MRVLGGQRPPPCQPRATPWVGQPKRSRALKGRPIYAAVLALALPGDEVLGALVGFIIRHLLRRMFREIGGGGMEDAAFAAIERELAAADGVDGHAGGIG